MAAFAPILDVSISDDGKTITYTNASNFDDNTEGFTEDQFTTNELILRDGYGDLLETIPFPTTGEDINKIVYEIDKDQWIDATLNLAGVASFTKLVRSGFYRIYMQAAKPYLQGGCCHMKHCDMFGKSQLFKDAAEDAIPIGDSVEFQENIDAANLYLKQAV